MDNTQLKRIIETALLVSDEPLNNKQLLGLFVGEELGIQDINKALTALQEDCRDKGIELKQLKSGFRFQSRSEMEPWLARLWQQKPKKFSRALLETLALIAYRQPITRGEIEDVRGVAVSSQIIHTLMDREWIRVLGHRDVPGKPAMFGTTATFLDDFNLTSLEALPTLAEIKDIESLEVDLEFPDPLRNAVARADTPVGSEESDA